MVVITLRVMFPHAEREVYLPRSLQNFAHHPDKLDGAALFCIARWLAHQLLHHPHEADGVVGLPQI